jgi:hypothetical protein
MTDMPDTVDDDEDLAAEIDDEPDTEPDTDGDDDDGDGDQPDLYPCMIANGPWAGRSVNIRKPLGFLLTDPEQRLAWVYDRDPQTWMCETRTAQPQALRDDGAALAADSDEFDILVLDAEIDPRAGEQAPS